MIFKEGYEKFLLEGINEIGKGFCDLFICENLCCLLVKLILNFKVVLLVLLLSYF